MRRNDPMRAHDEAVVTYAEYAKRRNYAHGAVTAGLFSVLRSLIFMIAALDGV